MNIFDEIANMEDMPKSAKDGEYEAIVNDIEITEGIFETKIKVVYQITTPEYAGQKSYQYLTIKEDDKSNEKKMRFIQWQLKSLTGLETLKGINVLEAVAQAKGSTVVIEVSTREYNGKNYTGATCKDFISKF